MFSEKYAFICEVVAAVTMYGPGVVLATGTGEVAMPDASVIAIVEELPLNVALAPDPGAVNVTVKPASGFPSKSRTRTFNAAANDVPAGVLCVVPVIAVIQPG